jgi:hypothetical protein
MGVGRAKQEAPARSPNPTGVSDGGPALAFRREGAPGLTSAEGTLLAGWPANPTALWRFQKEEARFGENRASSRRKEFWKWARQEIEVSRRLKLPAKGLGSI